MLRVMDRIPPLHPRPSTPATPAEITPGPAKWPAVLVLRPVTVFGPRISITGSMLAAMDSPMSEVSVLLQTPEDTPKVEFTHEVSMGVGRGTGFCFENGFVVHAVGGSEVVSDSSEVGWPVIFAGPSRVTQRDTTGPLTPSRLRETCPTYLTCFL